MLEPVNVNLNLEPVTRSGNFSVRTAAVKVPAADGQGDDAEVRWENEAADVRITPERMSWASNGEISTASFRRELGVRGGGPAEVQQRAEDAVRPHGRRVRLLERHAEPGRPDRTTEWFAGVTGMDGFNVAADPDREGYSFTAYGPELRLACKVVSGQWFRSAALDDKLLKGDKVTTNETVRAGAFATDLKVVFNPGGRPNCGQWKRWSLATGGQNSGRASDVGCGVFERPGRRVIVGGATRVQAVRWTAYRAVRSLVEWIDDYDVTAPPGENGTNWEAIYKVLGETGIPEVDVDCLNLLEAIAKVIKSAGFGFHLEPWSHRPGSWKHRLLVWRLKDPAKTVQPVMAPFGSEIDDIWGRSSEVHSIQFARDSHNVRNDVTVLGDRAQAGVELKFKAASTDLWPAWDQEKYPLSDYETDAVNKIIDFKSMNKELLRQFHERHNPEGKEFDKHRNVYRKFVWNEDGQHSQFAQSGGEPVVPDLSMHLIGGPLKTDYARIGRPLRGQLAYEDESKTRMRGVEVRLEGPNGLEVNITDCCEPLQHCAGIYIKREFFKAERAEGNLVYQELWRPFAGELADGADEAVVEAHFPQILYDILRGGGDFKDFWIAVYGGIEDDHCCSGVAGRKARSSWPLRSRKVIRKGGYRKYWLPMALNSLYGEAAYEPNQTDEASECAVTVRDASEDQMGHGSIMLRTISRQYSPGMGIPQLRGRNIDLRVDGGDLDDKRYVPIVRKVTFKFSDFPQTELTLDSDILRRTR